MDQGHTYAVKYPSQETRPGFSFRLIARALVFFSLLCNGVFSLDAHSAASDVASRLFNRLAGIPLPPSDPRRTTMETYINQGKLVDAARVATSEDSFYNITVRQFAAPMSNRAETALIPLNDFTAMFIGVARDNRDARELLYGNFLYVGDANNSAFLASCTTSDCIYTPLNGTDSPRNQLHFLALEKQNLARYLVRISPQRPNLTDAAGVLTTYSWSTSHFAGGTNRRATEYAFREFLCAPINELQDITMSDFRVRQDVDRNPGGVPATYQTTCKGCHAGMDALSGAWAYFDNEDTIQRSRVVPKYSQNSTVFPAGYVTRDDSWVNLFTKNQNAALGWRGPMSGNGASALGRMLANSGAFSSCMVKRAFKKVCLRDPLASEASLVLTLKEKFESTNYNLRQLLEETAIVPGCVGN